MTKDKSQGPTSENCLPLCSDNYCVMGGEPLIRVRDLDVSYSGKKVLEGVHLNADACSITALIGPSGCGKTTFLSCLNRLSEMLPQCSVSGTIEIGSTQVLDSSTDVLALRKKVGMVFQKPNPFPLSIWKNFALPLKYHGMRDEQAMAELIETSLRDVGLWEEVKDRLHKPAHALSGGQQQRLCIARSLVLKPEVLLFDEPCSALDPLSSEKVEELIVQLRGRYTVLVVTHNLPQARRISDYVAMFWTVDGVGRMVEQGRTSDIFCIPQHPQTAAYVSGRRG